MKREATMSEDETKKQRKDARTSQHSLFGISTKNWVHLVGRNGGIDRSYYSRGIFITLISLFNAPGRMLFKLRYGSKIKETNVQYPPVFIIGHWRSGTTYLHELLSQDPQFCYVSLWNTLLPDSFLIFEPMKKFLSRFLPSKRPMDEIKVEMDGPYKDEAALAVLFPWSFFHCVHFPRNAEEQYQKSVHFNGLSTEEKTKWKATYLTLIKTVTFANQGKRLLSKNPSNTARITTLLELFPQARFIHIYRNPYMVYLSTKKMRHNVLRQLALQDTSEDDIEKHVIHDYIALMERFFEQKKTLTPDQLVEIRYEDFISDPLAQVKQIYQQLKLPGLDHALPEMKKYLKKQSKYKTNVYAIDKKIIDYVDEHWKFTIDHWSYTPPK